MSTELAVVLLGATLGAFANGVTGTFFALIGVSIFLQVLPAAEAVALTVTLSILLNLSMLWHLRMGLRWTRIAPFLAGAALCVPLGVWALTVMNADLARRIIGALLVIYSAWMLARRTLPVVALTPATARWCDGAIGGVGGFLGGAFSMNGAVPTLWCGLRGWTKEEQRSVYQPYVLLTHVMTLAWLGGLNGTALRWDLLLWSLPALALGGWLGLKAYRHLSEALFRRLLLWLFVAAGLSLILR